MTTPFEQVAGLGAARLALTVHRLRAQSGGIDLLNAEPIAIVGVGLRFPGANDRPSFWRLLRDGCDAISEVPRERWNIDDYYDPRPGTPGRVSSRFGGFITDVDRFDARFFGMSPREAMSLDPQHRVLLEVAWHAIEDAGLPPQALAGSPTGVFIGITTDDYAQLQTSADVAADIYSGLGVTKSAAAGRLSYVLGLRGPSMAIDTACSSSLVAVHLACESLHREECRVALAGGVNLLLSPLGAIQLSQMKTLAPDGRCKTFDAAADGYVRSEGCGVVVLKRVSDAIADNDRVLALIRGSATNHDGRSGGLTVPNGNAQEAVVRGAIARAGIAPADVSYVEAHGSGTALGDPIEAQALGAVLGEGRAPGRPAIIGSVKTNIGHLEAAAGIAGLIKVVLMAAHREVPPHVHFREANPHIGMSGLPLAIVTDRTAWRVEPGQRRYAGVSGFGLTGTNAHVVIEEPPDDEPAAGEPARAHVLPLSAHTPEALRALVESWVEFLGADEPGVPIAGVCHTAAVRRAHHAERIAVVGRTHEEFANRLRAFMRGEASAVVTGSAASAVKPKVVFVFPGQGAQWIGMARSLSEGLPAFRDALARCDAVIRHEIGASIIEELERDSGTWRLDRIDLLQPALFAIQVALAAAWADLGVVPDAVIGHSMGEVAAAHVAGALSLEDASRVICRRSRLLRRLSGRGAMALVDLPLEETRHALSGRESQLSIAVSNSRRSTVVAGDPDAIDRLMAELDRSGVFARRVNVDVASHSPQMDSLRTDLVSALQDVRPARPAIRMYSTVTGAMLAGPECGADYWADNLRRPVLFGDAAARAAGDGHRVFVELSPHPIVGPAIDQVLADEGGNGLVVGTLRREEDEREVFLCAVAALYVAGVPIDWHHLYPAGSARPVALPLYPFGGERYWFETSARSRGRARGDRDGLGECYVPAAEPGLHVFEREVNTAWTPWLADHRVLGSVLLPAAAAVDLACRAAERTLGPGFAVEDVRFERALALPESATRVVQLSLRAGQPPRFVLHSRAGDEIAAAWQTHVTGLLTPAPPAPSEAPTFDALTARCAEMVSADAYYAAARLRGLDYGPSFRRLESIRRSQFEAVTVVRPDRADDSRQGVPVPVLDAAFQSLGVLIEDVPDGRDATWLPVAIGRVVMRAGAGLASRIWARRDELTDSADSMRGDVVLFDDEGRVAAEVRGLRLQRLAGTTRQTVSGGNHLADRALYEVCWHEIETPDQTTAVPRDAAWLLIADRGGVADRLATRLRASGGRAIVTTCQESGQVRGVLDEAIRSCGPALRGVICFSALDVTPPEQATASSLVADQALCCGTPLQLVQALVSAGLRDAPRLWFVTRGAQAVVSDQPSIAFGQAPLLGLGRVVAHEYPEFRCTRLDLDPRRSSAEDDALAAELIANGDEDELALRDGRRLCARIERARPSSGNRPPTRAGDRRFRIERAPSGVLEEIVLREIDRHRPGPHEVEIRVDAAGLNFLDVLKGLGVYPGQKRDDVALGGECAGTVTAVGDGVESLRVGDEVLAVAPGSFATHVIVPSCFVAQRPARLDMYQAATMPLAFVTAWYALHHIARLERGERLLIHSATGGTGMAALQVAEAIGAEVFATAGSDDRRTLLGSLGVRHVYDSRSTAFASAIMRDTSDEGVDVVLNTLSGDGRAAGMSILRQSGRMLDLSKRDIYEDRALSLGDFRRALSYTSIDIAGLAIQQPGRFASVFAEVVDGFAAGRWRPLPLERFPVTRVPEMLAHMAQARHVGKIALAFDSAADASIVPAHHPTVRADGSYLVTGGLGGLGLRVAQFLVDRGARHLVLVGRSAPSPDAARQVARLREAGTDVINEAADVSREADVAHVVERAIAMAPLRGIVHAAAVLDDATLLTQTPARFTGVLAPKALGALHLHTCSARQPLDFFVMFSSAASLLGSPGQANYAAANAFLDALAHHRRAAGQPALSINWGPWSDVGLAARENHGTRIAAAGIESFTPEEGIALFAGLLEQDRPQLGAMAFDVRRWSQSYPQVASSPLLSRLESSDHDPVQRAAPQTGILAELSRAAPAARTAHLTAWLCEQIGRVLRLPHARIEPAAALGALGFDSLTALELRNRLEAGLGLRLAATLIWRYPTVDTLVAHLERQLFAATDSPGSVEQQETPPSVERPAPDGPSDVARLSESAAEALLLDKLAALETERT
jgi:acyl transferase domain-containing protein/acyl carrier protein